MSDSSSGRMGRMRKASAVGRRPAADVAQRVRADRGPRERRVRHRAVVEDDARVERHEAFGRREERVDVELGDRGLLDDELAHAHEDPLEGREVDRAPPADAPERLEDARALHHPARQRRRQGREAERAVAEHLDELAAEPEQQHRPELGIDAAADDELDSRLPPIIGWTETPSMCSAP